MNCPMCAKIDFVGRCPHGRGEEFRIPPTISLGEMLIELQSKIYKLEGHADRLAERLEFEISDGCSPGSSRILRAWKEFRGGES